MVHVSRIIFASRLLEKCNCAPNAVIYSLLPTIDRKPHFMKGIYSHSLKNMPKLLDNAVNVFNGNRSGKSYELTRLNEEKDFFLKQVSLAKDWLKKEPVKITEDKVEAALSMISHIYLDTFFRPVQFFLPHSPTCSGQWQFWDEIDFFELTTKLNNKEYAFALREIVNDNSLWKVDMNLEDFSFVVKKRLLKDNSLGQPLDSAALVKAMIIRIGELATPHLNYEVIDGAIRSFCTHLKIKQYLRVDREIYFLRAIEQKIKDQLKANWRLTEITPLTHYI